MRIAILAPLVTAIREPQLGGSQAIVADLAHGLAARGHKVQLFAASGSRVPGVDVVDVGVHPEELTDALYRHGSGPQITDRLCSAFARAWKLIGEGDFDVVHNHAFDAPAVEFGRTFGRPVVHTLHLPPTAALVRPLLQARGGAVVACVSKAQARGWATKVRVHAILRNGVPVKRIPWSAHTGDGLVFAGRFSPEKGAAEAIEIARQAGLPITLVGSIYDRDYYRERIEPLARQDFVRVEPAVPREELWRVLARAQAVLCPIRWEEPFGLVAAEAQAAGTPVIGFARGGLPEIVSDKLTGALVPEGDIASAAIAATIYYERAPIRRHAERELDIASMIEAHERLYERVTAGRVPEPVM